MATLEAYVTEHRHIWETLEHIDITCINLEPAVEGGWVKNGCDRK